MKLSLTDKDTVTIPCMLAVYYITENKTKSPYKDCIIFCLYYYVFRTLCAKNENDI